MTVSIPALPAEVLATLTEAVEAVKEEVRQGTRLAEARRLAEIRRDYVTRNGYRYAAPSAGILAGAVPGVELDEPPAREATCGCGDPNCGRPDDPCENAYSCCGWCSDCDSHHGEGDNEVVSVPCRRGEHRYCLSCEHDCDDV